MSKIEINGVELELNLLDADVVEEYERLTKKIVARIQNKKAYEGKSNAEAMRYQCRCVDEFFDGLFGPGTSEELFPKKGDLAARMDGFGKAMGAMEDSRNCERNCWKIHTGQSTESSAETFGGESIETVCSETS